MNVKNILARFTGDNLTEAEKSEINAVDDAWNSYYAEQDKWNAHAYDSGMSGSEFRKGRNEIAQKHQNGKIINPLNL